MNGILNFIYVYIVFVIFWLIVNCVFYALTIVTKKGFFYIPFAINVVITWIIEIYFIIWPLYIAWQIVIAKEWLLLILALVFGSFVLGFWQMIISWITMPFGIMTAYFSGLASEKVEQTTEESDYEYISPDGKVIGKYISIDKRNKSVAKWFLIGYVIALANEFTLKNTGNVAPLLYIISPMLVFVVWSAIISFILGIWNLIKYRKIYGKDKYTYVTRSFKIFSIIYGLSVISNIIFYK